MKAAVSIILAIALAAVSLPVAANFHLRNVYRQTLAHWLSKVFPPPTVFIGDSIMTGGMWFDDVRNINLAANGLLTYQIAQYLPKARAYNPQRIVIMAGMNDALYGTDLSQLPGLWKEICAEPKIVVTLVTPSKQDDANRRIEQINHIVSEACQGHLILALDVADDSGRLKPEFALDSVHLNEKGYERWVAALITVSGPSVR